MNNVIEQIKRLSYGKRSGIVSPHKFALLLAIAKLYEDNPLRENRFCINDELERYFKYYFLQLAPSYNMSLATIDHPFYYLQNDGFWKLHIKQGMESQFYKIANSEHMRFTKKRIIELVSHASLSEHFDEFLRDENNRGVFCIELEKTFHTANLSTNITKGTFQRISMTKANVEYSNPFVGYLNSLQRLGASNENALAESQACNPQFTYIHVFHPLTQTILEELKSSNGKHVILTGHAGDGKSTIAVDVYKLLTDIPPDRPLANQLKPRENISGKGVSIIKDLSERHKDEDRALLQEFKNVANRFLLVTNTGTLLDLLRNHADFFEMDEVGLESKVLNAISNEQGEAVLSLGSIEFRVFNLARMDNLHIARQIFEKMLSPERWRECEGRDCKTTCPIYINVDLIQHNKQRIFERIFLAYRRMYEYGTRLTMRQITEHLAYLVTSGLEESDIEEMRKNNIAPLKVEYMFFNRFFGDNGQDEHLPAAQMQAIREIQQQGFGERPCPTWERRLWLRSHGKQFSLGVEDCGEEFELLREHGSRSGDDNRPGLTPGQAREQVRRMLYFLYDFSKEEEPYICQYLNSPTILRWQSWQEPNAQLDFNEKIVFEHRIYHVLQEHFTGVRLPEGSTQHDRRLYVTLSRRRSEVRQSAQVVLAQVDWSTATSLELVTLNTASSDRRTDLVLKGHDRINNIDLQLKLPFLDYVIMRHFGELGEVLQAAYLERLERFKAQVQQKAGSYDEKIMLVRLKTDHTFRRQQYSICNGTLEVSNVL